MAALLRIFEKIFLRIQSLIIPHRLVKGDYFQEIEKAKERSPFFKEEENLTPPSQISAQMISFYLPQFHPFEENNKFWGKGFTEWTNVTRSFPRFKSHYQPRLPKDLGFYDLRVPEVLAEQVRIAKNHGISAFCFHYYWFSGKKIMELPLRQFLNNKDLDLGFCLCWANENWTRRWDGKENDILLRQMNNENDDLAFIQDIAPYFKDARYIKIDNKPVLIVYRSELLKDARKSSQVWNQYVRNLGFNGIYLIATESFQDIHPSSIGFDAAMDFAPNRFPLQEITLEQEFFDPSFKGHIFEYRSAMELSLQKKKTYPFYKSLCLGWDNTARKRNNGTVLHNATPPAFGQWLEALVREKPLNGLVFINAWNEWAEGTYLEPDQRFGFAFLQECLRVANLRIGE